MLADSLAVVGHSWDLGQKRNGREPTLINRTDPGIEWPTTNVLQGQRHAWLSDYKYRKSLSDIGWTEQDIMLFDRIALENHAHLRNVPEVTMMIILHFFPLIIMNWRLTCCIVLGLRLESQLEHRKAKH